MRDVVVTPATRRTRPRRRRRRAAPVPPVPLPHSFHAFLAGARNDSLKKKTAASARQLPEPFPVRQPRFFFHALEQTPNSRTTARKAIAKVFAVKAAAENSDFVDSARRCRSTRGWFFSLAEFRKAESELARDARLSLSSAHPSFCVTRVMKGVFPSNVAWDVRVATHEPRAYRH
jgi:hypothetical protein